MNDRFGNTIDQGVGYARGRILSDGSREAARTAYGRQLVRRRFERFGSEGLFNLTGLIRGFPLEASHLPNLASQFHYYATFDGWPERLAVELMGGNAQAHAGFVLNRVSAATLALMGAILKPGDTVLSVLPRGRSHPSVERAVLMFGGQLVEVVGHEELTASLADAVRPVLAVVSPITHQKFHFDLSTLKRVIDILTSASVPIYLDDAHMSARVAALEQPRSFALGGRVVASTVSTDKHMRGPRAAAFVAEKELAWKVRAFAFTYGLEAQSGHATAAAVAIEQHDPAPIVEAAEIGRQLVAAMRDRFGECVYSTGVGAAISEEDLLSIAAGRAGRRPGIAPVDAANVLAMTLLEDHGIATIPAVGMPGSSPALRLMTYPDGKRCGVGTLVDAVDAALDAVAEEIDDVERAAFRILGLEAVA